MSEEAKQEEKSAENEEVNFDAVDLMLQGDLKSQINYSMIKGIADALDDKAQILIQAEHSFEPEEEDAVPAVKTSYKKQKKNNNSLISDEAPLCLPLQLELWVYHLIYQLVRH